MSYSFGALLLLKVVRSLEHNFVRNIVTAQNFEVNRKTTIACSRCWAPLSKTKLMIGGPSVQFICGSCVKTCNEIISTGRTMHQ